MTNAGIDRDWRRHLLGRTRPRAMLLATVGSLLVLASLAFVLGVDAGLSIGWVLLAFGIAVGAGVLGAGVGPTVGALWLVSLWWFAFPPLVGYLTGQWATSTRYHHPRMMTFAYTTARAELVGGIEYGVRIGLPVAILLGVIGYAIGAAVSRIARYR
ncbi:MAG: hypothetical protein ABEJ76_06275 [Halanaeroarchaeum sp.]